MFCRNCANEILPEAIACLNCGVPPMTGNEFCHSCGSGSHPAAIICVECGVSLTNPKSAASVSIKNASLQAFNEPGFWAAWVILIMFFRPWVDFSLATISGWELRDLVRFVRMADEDFKANGFIDLMYFLPVLSVLLIVSYLSKNEYLNSRIKSWKILLGIYPWVFFFSLLLTGAEKPTDWMAYGFYCTLAAAGYLLYDGIFLSKKKTLVPPEEVESTAESRNSDEVSEARDSDTSDISFNRNESNLETTLKSTGDADSVEIRPDNQEQLNQNARSNRFRKGWMIAFSVILAGSLLFLTSLFLRQKESEIANDDGTVLYFTNLSGEHDYKVIIKRLLNTADIDYDSSADSIIKTITVQVIKKATPEVYQSVVLDGRIFDHFLDLEDPSGGRSFLPGFNNDGEALDGDFGNFLVGDFNKDGTEDFAIKTHRAVGTAGSFYKFYTLRKNGLFSEDRFLTDSVGHPPFFNSTDSTFLVQRVDPERSTSSADAKFHTVVYRYNVDKEGWVRVGILYENDEKHAIHREHLTDFGTIDINYIFSFRSLDEIYRVFGEENVIYNRHTELTFGDIVPTEYIVYKNSINEFSILFDYEEVTGVVITEKYRGNLLSIPFNLRPGMSMDELAKVNKASFAVSRVFKDPNWFSGVLSKYPGCIQFEFRPKDDGLDIYDEMHEKYSHFHQFMHNDEDITKYQIRVKSIIFMCTII